LYRRALAAGPPAGNEIRMRKRLRGDPRFRHGAARLPEPL